MRERHPDLFSDSKVEVKGRLSKEVFEYHLETLTNRKQEYHFEHFCRKLAESEICPNLRPQTGPTGGGDSKVDSETYPVAEEISVHWWIGSPSAGSQRWAFAFSAKKDWKPKLRKDVKQVKSTGRDYSLVYFFTNQFARDKDRAALEDGLSREFGLPVHIVDRSWIIEKVYGADDWRFNAYLAALGVEGVRNEEYSKTGPRDTARLQELELLDRQTADSSRYEGVRYQLVEDYLRSAVVARGLERTRAEVDGRFERAARLAEEVGNDQQRLRVAYERAWSAFWWHEDYVAFGEQYEVVEELAAGSDSAHDANFLVNLWMLLLPSVANQRMGASEAGVESRADRLRKLLRLIADDANRPNNALEARTSLILVETVEALHSERPDDVESGWRELADVVESAAGLGSFPIERLFRGVKELGNYVGGVDFDALYEKLAEVMRLRRSDGAGGLAYAERGRQKLLQGRPYDAIGWFGRAEELLVKEEYRDELRSSLIGLSCGLEGAGLLWAARNKALACVDLALGAFHETGEMRPNSWRSSSRLVWSELKLGRILHAVYAMFLHAFVVSRSRLTDEEEATYTEEAHFNDLLLGALFLKLDMKSLTELTRLPAALERLGLAHARTALLFSLGHEATLREEGIISEEATACEVREFFTGWVQSAKAVEDVAAPVVVVGDTTSLRSRILGVEIRVETPNNVTSFGVAESLLGALEAFLATSEERSVFPYIERLSIVVVPDAAIDQLVAQFEDDDSSRVRLLHAPEVDSGLEAKLAYRDSLLECVAKLAPRMLMVRSPREWLEELVGEQRGVSRAVLFGDCVSMNDAVLVDFSLVTPKGWIAGDDREYLVLRDQPWWPGQAKVEEKVLGKDDGPGLVSETVRVDARKGRQRLRHTDFRVLSPIDVPLWDRAKWRGVLVATIEGGPPVLGLGFENHEAGQAIFRAWRERMGVIDGSEALRVAIVRGVSKRNPAEYGVSIGPGFDPGSGETAKAFFSVSRIQRMTPQTSENLDRFLEGYGSIGGYILAPVPLVGAEERVSEAIVEYGIRKRSLEVRQAWEIGENDPDVAMLFEGDEPIIPAGVGDPPVFSALRRRFGNSEGGRG